MILALLTAGAITVLWWCVIALGSIGLALTCGIELGCYSLNRVRLMLRAGSPTDRSARLIRTELEKPDRLLATLMIGNVAFSALITNATHALMKGDRLTVVLNGKTVIEHAQLPGVPAEGPIALQKHGDPIEFGNLMIKELK